MQAQYRNLWRHAASPVSIITTALDKQLAGMTISSLTSVSMGPPQLLVSFNCQVPSRTSEMLQARNKLVLNMLGATPSNALLAEVFAGKAAEGHNTNPFVKYPELFEMTPDSEGIPTIKAFSTKLFCKVQHILPAQDHEIVVASVEKMWIGQLAPMIYRQHKFWSLGDEIKH